MWRSLFLAVGIYSLLLGGQTLVVDQFLTAGPRDLPGIRDSNAANINQASYSAPGYYNTNSQANPFARNAANPAPNIDPAVNDNRYLTGLQHSPYQLTGYGSGNNGGSYDSGYRTDGFSTGGDQYETAFQPAPGSLVRQRIIRTKDWMPWSLIAFGSVVVIYTTSFSRRGSD